MKLKNFLLKLNNILEKQEVKVKEKNENLVAIFNPSLAFETNLLRVESFDFRLQFSSNFLAFPIIFNPPKS